MAKTTENKVYLDLIEVNASEALRTALSAATGCSLKTHMLLDRNCIPLLQGISHDVERRNEANNLIHTLQANGIVVLCPRPE